MAYSPKHHFHLCLSGRVPSEKGRLLNPINPTVRPSRRKPGCHCRSRLLREAPDRPVALTPWQTAAVGQAPQLASRVLLSPQPCAPLPPRPHRKPPEEQGPGVLGPLPLPPSSWEKRLRLKSGRSVPLGPCEGQEQGGEGAAEGWLLEPSGKSPENQQVYLRLSPSHGERGPERVADGRQRPPG